MLDITGLVGAPWASEPFKQQRLDKDRAGYRFDNSIRPKSSVNVNYLPVEMKEYIYYIYRVYPARLTMDLCGFDVRPAGNKTKYMFWGLEVFLKVYRKPFLDNF